MRRSRAQPLAVSSRTSHSHPQLPRNRPSNRGILLLTLRRKPRRVRDIFFRRLLYCIHRDRCWLAYRSTDGFRHVPPLRCTTNMVSSRNGRCFLDEISMMARSSVHVPLACFLVLVGVRPTSAQCYRFSSGTAASLTVNITNLPQPKIIPTGIGFRYDYNLDRLTGNTVTLSLGASTHSGSVFQPSGPDPTFSIIVSSGPSITLLEILAGSKDNNGNGFSAMVILSAGSNSKQLDLAVPTPNPLPSGLLPDGLLPTLPSISAWSTAFISAALLTGPSYTPFHGTLDAVGSCSCPTLPAPYDILLYKNATGEYIHVAMIAPAGVQGATVTRVISKWGRMGLYEHDPDDGGYGHDWTVWHTNSHKNNGPNPNTLNELNGTFSTDKGYAIVPDFPVPPLSIDETRMRIDNLCPGRGLYDALTKLALPSAQYDCYGYVFADSKIRIPATVHWPFSVDQIEKIREDNGYNCTIPARHAGGNICK
jgi:hypothetical protein